MKINEVDNRERGYILLATLLVLAIVCIILCGVIFAAFANSRISHLDYCCMQAWQAADAGIEAARYEVRRCLSDGEALPESLQVELQNYAIATVSIDSSNLKYNAIVRMVSTGYFAGAKKEITIDIDVNTFKTASEEKEAEKIF